MKKKFNVTGYKELIDMKNCVPGRKLFQIIEVSNKCGQAIYL